MSLAIGATPLQNVLHVVVEKQVMEVVAGQEANITPPPPLDGCTLATVSNLEKRGSYTPKRVREQRAYRLVVAGGVAGTVGVVGLVLAVVGVIGSGLPIIALIVAAMCAVLFRRLVGSR